MGRKDYPGGREKTVADEIQSFAQSLPQLIAEKTRFSEAVLRVLPLSERRGLLGLPGEVDEALRYKGRVIRFGYEPDCSQQVWALVEYDPEDTPLDVARLEELLETPHSVVHGETGRRSDRRLVSKGKIFDDYAEDQVTLRYFLTTRAFERGREEVFGAFWYNFRPLFKAIDESG
jgi:hypothetical protein